MKDKPVKSLQELYEELYNSPDGIALKKQFNYYDMMDFAEYLGEYYGFYTKTKTS